MISFLIAFPYPVTIFDLLEDVLLLTDKRGKIYYDSGNVVFTVQHPCHVTLPRRI